MFFFCCVNVHWEKYFPSVELRTELRGLEGVTRTYIEISIFGEITINLWADFSILPEKMQISLCCILLLLYCVSNVADLAQGLSQKLQPFTWVLEQQI